MKYEVTVIMDATCSTTVEADSPEAAADKALEEVGFVNLCHQCAREVEIGDAAGAHVYDSNTKTHILDTTYSGERIRRLEDEVERLKAALAAQKESK